MQKGFFLFALTLAFGLVLTNCRKENTISEALLDQVTTEDLATNVDYDEEAELDEDEAVNERGGCPTVTAQFPAGTWPNTFTVDFGDNCVRPNGRVLKGKITVVQTDSSILVPGCVRTVTYGSDFYVDDIQVSGTKTRTNNGLDAQGRLNFTKDVNKTLTFTDGTTAHWTGNFTATLIAGQDTKTRDDNDWSIVGGGSGVNRKGDDFTATIVEPLVKNHDCRWISEGILSWTKNSRTRSLDFGDGSCDDKGELTLANGTTVTIKLRR